MAFLWETLCKQLMISKCNKLTAVVMDVSRSFSVFLSLSVEQCDRICIDCLQSGDKTPLVVRCLIVLPGVQEILGHAKHVRHSVRQQDYTVY